MASFVSRGTMRRSDFGDRCVGGHTGAPREVWGSWRDLRSVGLSMVLNEHRVKQPFCDCFSHAKRAIGALPAKLGSAWFGDFASHQASGNF